MIYKNKRNNNYLAKTIGNGRAVIVVAINREYPVGTEFNMHMSAWIPLTFKDWERLGFNYYLRLL